MLYLCAVFLLHRKFPNSLLCKDCKKRHKKQETSSEQKFLFAFQDLKVPSEIQELF